MAQGCLLKIISTLRYLARQGLATRGHIESEGNFLQLLQVQSEDSPELSSWLKRRDNWVSHDIQNEIMTHPVLKGISNVAKQSKYFTIIVDEATDVSFKGRYLLPSVCFRRNTRNP